MKSTRDRILAMSIDTPTFYHNGIWQPKLELTLFLFATIYPACRSKDLISAEEERHGVGRPRQIYNLTESGFGEIPDQLFTVNHEDPGPDEEHTTSPGSGKTFHRNRPGYELELSRSG